MNHIVRNSTLCGDDWCDAKREIAALKNTLAIHDKLFDERDAKIALLREALDRLGHHEICHESCEVCKLLATPDDSSALDRRLQEEYQRGYDAGIMMPNSGG